MIKKNYIMIYMKKIIYDSTLTRENPLSRNTCTYYNKKKKFINKSYFNYYIRENQ